MTEKGFTLLKKFEGLRHRPYKDVAGYWTVGYGHMIGKTLPSKYNRMWDIQKIDQLLLDDVGIAQRAVLSNVKVLLNKYQRDALTCFVFNVGVEAFKDSTLLKLLNLGQYEKVPGQLARWTRAGGQVVFGLVARRKAERDLWNTPYLA